MEAAEPDAEHPDLKEVQGNLIGFNKDQQRFAVLHFADQASGRAFLADIEPDLASGWEVKHFNALFKEIHKRGGRSGTVEAAWINLALSAKGLELLGAPGLEAFPEEFQSGMASRAEAIGDLDDSAPPGWTLPFNDPAQIHALATLAADAPEDLETSYAALKAKMEAHQVAELASPFEGKVREGDNRGKEHFGFKDGISQPGIAGLTTPSKRGQDPIAAGEFIIGYPNQDGQISGQPTPAPQEGSPDYNPTAPPPPPAPLPDWTRDGSFLVFRRLRQDVQAFNDFLTQTGGEHGIDAELLGAKLVGRWKSGAPLERTRDQGPEVDPAAHDPSIDDPSILDDAKINNFDYDQDPDGTLVPRAAHIRKTNPRSEAPPGKEVSNRHRILRRGIPYGPELQPGEPAYPGQGPVPDTQDRGLLFLCYQASIARGFEFVQSAWANNEGFPQAGDGHDAIISQNVETRSFHLLSPQELHLEMARWVATTGGEYFFAPSLSDLRFLAAPDATA
jgi:Dyp-type peroxidase family